MDFTIRRSTLGAKIRLRLHLEQFECFLLIAIASCIKLVDPTSVKLSGSASY